MSRCPIPKYRKDSKGLAYVCHRSIPNKTHRKYLSKYGSDDSIWAYNQFLRRLQAIKEKEDALYEFPDFDEIPTVMELALAFDVRFSVV